MKILAPTLALLAVLALVPSALSAAEPAAAPAAAAVTAPVSVDQFFATLSSPASPLSKAVKADPGIFATITCHTTADCPAGQLCCYPCGIPDCNFVCMKVKRCPLIP